MFLAGTTAPVAARFEDPGTSSTSATDGQPPPSQHDSIFCQQSWHHQAERIQKSRWACPVIAQSIG